MKYARWLLIIIVVGIILTNVSLSSDKPPQFAKITVPHESIKFNVQNDNFFQPTTQLQHVIQQLNKRLMQRPHDHEASLLKSLFYFKAGDVDHAISELDQLIKNAPEFHLAHLIRGDLLVSRLHPISDVGKNALLANLDNNQELILLRDEAHTRLQAYLNKIDEGHVPRQLLQLSQSVDKAILVDKTQHRLYIYQRRTGDMPPQQIGNYYISTGKQPGNKQTRGDLRTPEGIYFVTQWLSDDKLPEKYGIGAFPLDYPNTYDQKLGKTGDGIWLHGTERIYYSRPPLDSEGCGVLANVDFQSIKKHITPGITPVIITAKVNWVDPDLWLQERRSILAAIERWRNDWESLNTKNYLSHYSDDFWTNTHNIKSWTKRKRYLAKSKTFQKIDISNLSLYSYPKSASDGQELVVARFAQNYRSNNFNSEMQKRLYMRRERNTWRILYEGQ